MDPFYLKLQVEKGSYICAHTRGVLFNIGIQIEQSTNQPKLFTNLEIQPEVCIVIERRWHVKHKIEPFLVKIDKATATGRKKIQTHQNSNVPYRFKFCTETSYVNHTLSLKARDMQRNCRTYSGASHYLVMKRPTCSATNKVIFFATILDRKKWSLTWNKITSHLIASKDASMKTFTCLLIHNFISLHLILPRQYSATHRSLACHQLKNNNINSTTDTLMRSGRKGYTPLEELRKQMQHQPSHD